MQVIPADTTPEAFRVHMNALRRLTQAQRAKMTFELSDNVRSLAAAGVRRRHPDYDEEQVRLATIRLVLGDAFFRKVYPGVEIAP